jgi:hypothetical protein
MADNTQNTGPQPSSQPKFSGKELLDSLKEQLRLEGDYRDILRDSIRELQKSIKYHDTISAKLEVYSNSTINIKQVQTDINNNLFKQNVNKIKLNETTKKLGGIESEQVKIADQYLKSLEERSILEDSFLTERSKFITLENKLKATKKDEFNSLNEYFGKLEDQRKLELYIASLSERKGKNAQKDLEFNKQKLDRLKNEITLQESSLSVEQKEYINGKNVLTQASEAINKKEDEISVMQKGLNLEQAAYIQAKKTNELYESNNEKLKSQQDFEKRSQQNAGVLGKLVGGVAQKFGIAENVQEAMVQQQKKLAAEALITGRNSGTFSDKLSVAKVGLKSLGKNLVDTFKTDPVFKYGAAIGVAALAYKGLEAGLDMVGNAAAKTGNFLAGLSEDSGTVVRGLTSGLSDIARKIPLVGGLLGGLIDGFSALLDLILGVDNMIVKTGRQLNLSAEAARGLYRQFGSISQASGDIYMNGKKYLESQLELTNQLGTTNILNQEILKTNIKLKDFAGLEADTRAKIAESAQITGKSSENTVKAVLSQVVGLRRATGVSFQYQQVLKEVSNLGGYLGLQFAKYPKELTKTYLATKTLGLELKQLDGMASSFLDFESSISKEFEAQLLTGKEINLNKARELFLNNDLAGAAAEIAKYTGDAAGYSKMNRIQQDSFAEALGMSRDQMADMLKQQELYSKFQVKNREDLLKQVDLLRKSGNAQEAINKAGSVAAYNDLVRASAQEKLAMFIEKIKQSIVEFIENTNFIEKVEKFINMLSNPDTIKGILGKIRDVISTFIEIVGEVLADVIEVGGEIANFFTFGKKGDEREAKAYEFAAKVREGSLEMSKRVAGFGVENKPVSVGENAAKEKAGVNKNVSEDNMKMAKPTVINNTTVMVKPVDGQALVSTTSEYSYNDINTGVMAGQQSGRSSFATTTQQRTQMS